MGNMKATLESLETHLQIGAIIFPGMDQADFTGPFEVLSRVPDSTYHVIAKELSPVRDARGLVFTPEKRLPESPRLDVLHVPGGYGVDALMEDEEVLSFIRQQAATARIVFSVCTGALLCGAAGLLVGKKATTHWASFHLLEYFGAIPVHQRVVTDGNLISAAGVTSGIDGALTVAAQLRGAHEAQKIQLYMQYAPEPPFHSGTPETAPAEVLAGVKGDIRATVEKRSDVARRVGARLGITL